MGIFLLCIPLVIFIIAEGVILYFLTDTIIQALNDYGYSSTTMVDNVFPALNAILYVFLLMLAIAIAIYLYIRFAIKPALNKNKDKDKKRKTEKTNVSGIYPSSLNELNGNLNAKATIINPNFSNLNNLNYAENFNAEDIEMNGDPDNSGKKKKRKNRRKKKSKKPLIIIIAVAVLIIGAAAYLFIFQHDLIKPFLFWEKSTTEAVESETAGDTTEAAAEITTEEDTSDNNAPIDDTTEESTTEATPSEPTTPEETT